MNIGEHKRQSILAGFNTEIVKGDENEFSTPESFEKAVADNKWLVYTEENIEAFEKALNDKLNDLTKGGDEASKAELIKKSHMDFGNLTAKMIIDKRGFSKKVWVSSNGGDNTATEHHASSEDTKASHQQLLDEKISKKNHKQMTAHKEDVEYEEQEKKLNDMAHEVVDKKAEGKFYKDGSTFEKKEGVGELEQSFNGQTTQYKDADGKLVATYHEPTNIGHVYIEPADRNEDFSDAEFKQAPTLTKKEKQKGNRKLHDAFKKIESHYDNTTGGDAFVNEWSDKIQDIHLVVDSPEAIQQFQDIANEYGYKDKYDGKNWLENWIEGEGLTDEKLKEIHGKLSKIK